MTANKTERTLDRTGDKQDLSGIVGDRDPQDVDIFGYEVFYTTGEFVVNREELVDKLDELEIPEWMHPSQTRPHNAFGYAIDDLLEGREEVEIATPKSDVVDSQRVQFNLRQNENRYSYTLDASMWFPPEMTGRDEGQWVAVESEREDGTGSRQGIGRIEYRNPDEGAPHVATETYIPEDHTLYVLWAAEADDPLKGGLRQRALALFQRHWKQWNRGKDINNLTYYLVDKWTDSIKFRDACYFVPANHEWRDASGQQRPVEDLIDAFRSLYSWLNVHKREPDSEIVLGPDQAQDTSMGTIEIMDSERQREVVEQKAERRLEDMAEDVAEQTLDALEEATLSEVPQEVAGEVENILAVADNYDGLMGGGRKAQLKAENAVQRAVQSALDDLEDGQAEMVEEVLDELDAMPEKATA